MRKLCLIKSLAAAQIASCLGAKHVVGILSWWLGLSCPAVGALFGSRHLQLLTKWPAAIGRSGWCKQWRITAKAWLQIWPAFLWQTWLPTLHGVATNLASARCKGYKDRNDWLAKMYRLQQVQKFGKRNHNNLLWIMFCQPKGSNVQRSLHELRIIMSSQFHAAYSYWFILSFRCKTACRANTQNSWPTGLNLHNQPDKPFASKNICAWKARPLWIWTLQL